MSDRTVSTEELLGILKANRADHRNRFLQALKGYRAQVIELLEADIERARQGRDIDMTVFRLTRPEDHTSDYDREIKMLQMHTGNTVTLDAEEAERYVMDSWHWSGRFEATATSYGA